MSSNAKTSKAPQPSEPGQKIPVWSWRGAILAADLEPMTKLVCLAIAHYLSEAGKGWRVSVKQLMADTGIKSNKTISTHLDKAEAAGLLVIERTFKSNGQRGVNFYKPRFPDTVELSREPAELPGDDGASDPSRPSVPRTPGSASPSVPPTPSPRVRRTPRPSVARTRQESFQQEGSFQQESFQERARRAPEDEAPVVESEIVQPPKREAKAKRKQANEPPHCQGTLVGIKADETYVPGKRMTLAQAMTKGWKPSEQAWSLAVKMLGSEQAAEMEAVQFTNYWEGEGTAKANWNSKFLKWVGDELKKRREKGEIAKQRAAGREPFSYSDFVRPEA